MRSIKKSIIAIALSCALLACASCANEVRVKPVSAELKGTVQDNFGYGLALYENAQQNEINSELGEAFKGQSTFGDSVFEIGTYRWHANTDTFKTFEDEDAFSSFQTKMLSYYFDNVTEWANTKTVMYSDGEFAWCGVISELTQKPVLAVLTDDYFVTGELATVILMLKTNGSPLANMDAYMNFYNERLEKAGYTHISWQEPKEVG